MKPLALFFALLLLLSAPSNVSCYAQNTKTAPAVKFPDEKPNFQGILQMKYNYIKDNLTIAGKNADKFWTLYDQYIKEEGAIHTSFKKALDSKKITREALKEGKGSDEQLSFFMSQKMSFKDKMYLLDKKFYNNAKELLSAKELFDFYLLEQNFKSQCTKKQKSVNANSKKSVPVQKFQPPK